MKRSRQSRMFRKLSLALAVCGLISMEASLAYSSQPNDHQVNIRLKDLKASIPNGANLVVSMEADERSAYLFYESFSDKTKRCQSGKFEIDRDGVRGDTGNDLRATVTKSGSRNHIQVISGSPLNNIRDQERTDSKTPSIIYSGNGGISSDGRTLFAGNQDGFGFKAVGSDSKTHCDDEPLSSKKIAMPEPPKRTAIGWGENRSLVGITELVPNTGVYVISRHALQKHAQADLSRLHSALSGFRIFEVNISGQSLDVVILIEDEKVSDSLTDRQVLKKKITKVIRSVTAGDLFASHLLAADLNNKATSHAAIGRVLRTDSDSFYLENTSENFATKSSSGALIYTRSVKDRDRSNEWKPSGVLQCFIPAQKDSAEVQHPAQYKVLNLSLLKQSELQESSIEDLSRQDPIRQPPGCIPFDGRDGGGG